MLSWLPASQVERMLARETARYAVHDHGDQAEEHLLARIRRLRSRKRRRIYRIAIREIQRVSGTTDKASRDAMAKDDLHGVAVDALALIAKATRQIEDATSEIQGSPHRHAFFFRRRPPA